MRGPQVVWAVGMALMIIGELWAVATERRGDTITEWTFQHPLTMVMGCSFLIWAVWHFGFARGKPEWLDLVFVALGGLLGLSAYRRGQPKEDEQDSA